MKKTIKDLLYDNYQLKETVKLLESKIDNQKNETKDAYIKVLEEEIKAISGQDLSIEAQDLIDSVGIWQKKYNDLEGEHRELLAKSNALERELCECEARASTVTTEINELRRQNKD